MCVCVGCPVSQTWTTVQLCCLSLMRVVLHDTMLFLVGFDGELVMVMDNGVENFDLSLVSICALLVFPSLVCLSEAVFAYLF